MANDFDFTHIEAFLPRLPRIGSCYATGRPMLEGLDSIPWVQLQHAYGEAGDVPALLRALASADDQEREQALGDLYGNIWHQGTVLEATTYAVPFLVELARAREVQCRADILGLIGAIADNGTGSPEPHKEVLRHADTFVRLTDDDDPIVRAGAAYVLGFMRELAPEIAAQLRGRIEVERDVVARSSMWLALAELAVTSTENVEWLRRRFNACSDERERFAASVALAHCAREAIPEAALTILARSCKDPTANSTRFEEFRWDNAAEQIPRRALVATGNAGGRVLPILLDDLRRTGDAVTASFLLEDTLAVAFGEEERDEPPSSLTEVQRHVLRAVLDVPLLWTDQSLVPSAFAQHELPSNRDDRLSFLDR